MLKRFICQYHHKVCISSAEAVKDISSKCTLLVGGFGLCGIPENLLLALSCRPVNQLTVVSDSAGIDNQGVGKLLKKHQVSKMFSSYVGDHREFLRQYLEGELELEFVPQGTLAERVRAGGAGIPAFYTPTGVDTLVHNGGVPTLHKDHQVIRTSKPKPTRDFNGKPYLLEEAIKGDYALIQAYKGDAFGNLVFKESARNFNPVMAKAAKITIAEVEQVVPVGSLHPDQIHLPGIYVDRIVQGEHYDHLVERERYSDSDIGLSQNNKRTKIAKRAAKEFKDGMYVNLGIGIPTLSACFVDPSVRVMLHSENGILGMGSFPKKGHLDSCVINAGKESVTIIPGGSTFASDESFSMIRGGHLNLTVLGALEVSANGDLANWLIPQKVVKGMGGAMDLASSNTRLIVTMEHISKNGGFKIKEKCDLPLTAKQCVDRIITDLCVFDVEQGELILIELMDGVTLEEVKAKTGCSFKVDLK